MKDPEKEKAIEVFELVGNMSPDGRIKTIASLLCGLLYMVKPEHREDVAKELIKECLERTAKTEEKREEGINQEWTIH